MGPARVVDGDTIVVAGTKVRLEGLHAPELDEHLGRPAQAFVRDLLAGATVRCKLTGERTYDRMVGRCLVGGVDIAAALVDVGLGRDCRRYSLGRYSHLERPEAQAIRLPGYCTPR